MMVHGRRVASGLAYGIVGGLGDSREDHRHRPCCHVAVSGQRDRSMDAHVWC